MFCMWKKFYPDHYAVSTYKICYQKLYDKGYRGILFDIDNTLVCHNAPADERSIRLIAELKQIGFRVMVVSNNKEPRVQSFCNQVGCDYVYKAGKPLKRGYLAAMQKMQTTPENTIFIGDQIFTDTLGAKFLGILTYLVQPIHKKEEIQIVLKRIPEKWILREYLRTHELEADTEAYL